MQIRQFVTIWYALYPQRLLFVETLLQRTRHLVILNLRNVNFATASNNNVSVRCVDRVDTQHEKYFE